MRKENTFNDQGCWKLLQAVIARAFEQADMPKEVDSVYEFALRAKQGHNLIFHCFSELGEHDYDKIVNLLIDRCETTKRNNVVAKDIIKDENSFFLR
jgi:hypothetical protein